MNIGGVSVEEKLRDKSAVIEWMYPGCADDKADSIIIDLVDTRVVYEIRIHLDFSTDEWVVEQNRYREIDEAEALERGLDYIGDEDDWKEVARFKNQE